MNINSKLTKLISLALAFFLVFPLIPNCVSAEEESSFQIDFVDVGQANATLIRCDGKSMLIDGGNKSDSSLIYSFLKKQNVKYLDYMVATHPHEDHVGGLSGALNYAKVGTVYSSVKTHDSDAFNDFLKNLNKQKKSITVPKAGDSFKFGSANVEILGPVENGKDENNNSIVLRITYGETSFLFCGDAELEEETSILDEEYDISCAVLMVGHHGSANSTNYRWLREAAPKYAVISVGKDNTYGHPTEETLSRLHDAEVTVFRTDLQGDIICTSDGKNVNFTVERNKDADTLKPHIEETKSAPTIAAVTSTGNTYILNTNTKKFRKRQI